MTAPRREPFVRRFHPLEVPRLPEAGGLCDVRRCRRPATIYAWHYPNALGGQIGAERQLCDPHGEEFARRHGLTIGPAPEESQLPPPRPAPRPGAYLAGMSAEQLRLHEEGGWHCDQPRCTRLARYLSSLHYEQGGRMRFRTRFLCIPHAERFAARRGLDMAGVRPPEVSQ